MCVHTRHCCLKHWCKYGDEDCPVKLGTAKQEFKCEYCHDDSERLQPVLDMLNEAFKNDPSAIHSLMVNRVPCNIALADHPQIIVDKTVVIDDNYFTVGAIGLINGVLSCLGLPLIAAKWSNEIPNKLLGFCEYEEE